jgi:hypothetical protein
MFMNLIILETALFQQITQLKEGSLHAGPVGHPKMLLSLSCSHQFDAACLSRSYRSAAKAGYEVISTSKFVFL